MGSVWLAEHLTLGSEVAIKVLEPANALAIEARAWAEELGLGFTRVPALNTAPGLIDALAAAVRRALFR